jgi:hypothetical protein
MSAAKLVIRKPWPSMLRTIWGDKARYKKQYWSEIKGFYFTGESTLVHSGLEVCSPLQPSFECSNLNRSWDENVRFTLPLVAGEDASAHALTPDY